MYRGRLWTMRQYAGMGDAEESNKRYKYLLANGTTGLSVAFDLPTQIGLDSDNALAIGEVGKVGVAIDSIEDMQRLFDGIELTKISTSMTINATASILLALYVAVAKRQGGDPKKLSGTVQNDVLEGIHCARDLHLSAAAGHAHHHRPVCMGQRSRSRVEHHFDLRLPHARGRIDRRAGGGLHPRQRHRLRAGGDRSRARRRQVRAAALVLLQRAQQLPGGGRQVSRGPPHVGAHHARSLPGQEPTLLDAPLPHANGRLDPDRAAAGEQHRPHCHSGLAAVLGGTQSLHTNSFDEALALPTEQSARIALRTQQIVAFESGAPQTIDPLAGSYYIESLTNEIEKGAQQYLDKIDALGGMLKAIERGYVQQEIQNAAYEYQQQVDRLEAVVVGVNRFTVDEEKEIPIQRIDENAGTEAGRAPARTARAP